MRRTTMFVTATALTVASVWVFAMRNDSAANSAAVRPASIDPFQLHLEADVQNLPVLVIQGYI